MVKRFIYTVVIFFAAIVVLAVPAKRGQWITITVADGSKTEAELIGDENGHCWQTADGRLYVPDTEVNGWREIDKNDFERRQAESIAKRNSIRLGRLRKASSRREVFGEPTDYTGNHKALIILVNYTDVSFKEANDREFFNRMTNEKGFLSGRFNGSIHDYFYDQSNGLLDLHFDVVGPVTLSHETKYYGANDNDGIDLRAGEMIAEACMLIKDSVDFSLYDWDGDGEIENLYVVYAGYGEADNSYTMPNTIWPHQWELSESDYGKKLQIDNTLIDTYACGSELNASGATIGIGTMCHEFSHCLGLPDLYNTQKSNTYTTIDSWSLMNYGLYNNGGYTPPSYTSHERYFCGWQKPVELYNDTTVTGMASISDYGDTYIYHNPACNDEYIIISNIRKKGWDRYAAGSGMMIMHIDYDYNAWAANAPNNDGSHERCTLYLAKNRTKNIGSSSTDLWGGSNTSFSDTSDTPARFYNPDSDGNYLAHIEISDITSYSDGTMGFTFKNHNIKADAIRDVKTRRVNSDNSIYTPDGRRVDRVSKKGLYIVGGRKVVL